MLFNFTEETQEKTQKLGIFIVGVLMPTFAILSYIFEN